MLARVEMVSTVVAGFVPSKLTLAGLKLQVAPVGNPVQLLGLKFTTIPVEPVVKGEIVSVVKVDCPAGTGVGLRVPAVNKKSGASKANTSLSASIEPRPVTRL